MLEASFSGSASKVLAFSGWSCLLPLERQKASKGKSEK